MTGRKRARRLYTDADREGFYVTLGAFRRACLNVREKAPIGGLDDRTAEQLLERIDDAVEALTGNRRALCIRILNNGRRGLQPLPVLPVEPEDSESS